MQLNKMGHDVKVIFPENYRIAEDRFQTHEIIFSNGKNKEFDIPFNFPCFTSHPRSNNTFYKLNNDEIELYVNKFKEAIDSEIELFKPDIIHAQHLWITPYAALTSGVPYIVTVHGTDLMGFKKDKRYHKYALEGAINAAKIITISRQVHNDTLELYKLPENKLKLNPNGFDDDMFRPKNINKKELFTQFGLDIEPGKLVSFVGKFTDFKGIDILIKAARKVTDEIPEVVFLILSSAEPLVHCLIL